jgi:hypothetical protein
MAMITDLKVSCRKATLWMERREFRALGPGERLGLWFHLRICLGCRRYERQSMMLDELLRSRMDTARDAGDLEARIIERIGS